MRRYNSSCRPALLSKNHFTPVFTSGTGKGPVLISHEQERAIPSLFVYGNLCLLASLGREIGGTLAVLSEFTNEDDFVTAGTEDFRQRGDVELFGRIDQRIGSLLRSVEELGPGE